MKRAQPSLEDEVQSALTWLKRHSTKRTREGMARYAIPSDNAFGVSASDIRVLGKRLGRNHELAAFALLWALTVHDKHAGGEPFVRGLHLIERAADDERHFVKKAVNMALRAIDKRNPSLNAAAVAVARRLALRRKQRPDGTAKARCANWRVRKCARDWLAEPGEPRDDPPIHGPTTPHWNRKTHRCRQQKRRGPAS